MASHIGMANPLCNDWPINFEVYDKYFIIVLYTMCTVSWCMMPCNFEDIYSITESLNPSSQLGMAGHIVMDAAFYKDWPMIFVVYYKYCIIALYTIITVPWGMISRNAMDIYSTPRRLNTSHQWGMASQIWMDETFYKDRPMTFIVYYKYCIIALYTMITVSWSIVSCNTVDKYSIQESLNTSGQLGMAGHRGMNAPFYNDRPVYF